jgi:hypothetical protein
LPGRVIFGVDEYCPDTGDIRGLCGAENRIFEKCPAQPLRLVHPVHRQAGENHRRNRMSGQPFYHSRWCILMGDTANAQTVKANHPAFGAADIGLGTVGPLIDQSVALQKLIKRRLATIKRRYLICSAQFAYRFKAGHDQSSSPGSVNNFFSRGRERGGASSAC